MRVKRQTVEERAEEMSRKYTKTAIVRKVVAGLGRTGNAISLNKDSLAEIAVILEMVDVYAEEEDSDE